MSDDAEEKREKLVKLLEEVQKLYPNLDRVMITDLEDPRSIIFTTEDNIQEIADEYGLEPDYLDSITEEVEVEVGSLDDDDDDDKGLLQ